MKTSSQRAIVGILMALGSGCDDSTTMLPSGVGTNPTGGTAAPVASGGSAAPSVGTTAGKGATAGATATAGRPVSSVGTGGSVSPPPTATAGASAAAGGTVAAAAGGGGGAAGVAGGSAVASAGSGGGGAPPVSAAGFPQLPRVTTTDGPGPFTGGVVKVKNTPPGGWLIYPKDIGMGGMKHPLFIFGPGGGTTPDTYEQMGMHWDRYGSYGFVIYVLPMSTGDGAPMKAGLDWLIKQDTDMASPLFGHLDTSKVTAAGHSQGSITTFAFMPDDRVTTTIHISGGSTGGAGPKKLKNDTMFLCGPSGSDDVAFPQCETDFTASTVPTFYTNIQGSTHLTSGRLGWASIIAWNLWHLADQGDQWKKEFVEETGMFHQGIYKSQVKNW
jgi:hypothetical protein